MYKNILTATILITFSFVFFYLNGIVGVLEFLLSICIYTIIFYFLYLGFKKITRKLPMMISDFIKYFLFRLSMIIVFTTGFIGGGAYLLNTHFPAVMPEYTISNGEKTVKFQAMVHIGQKSYYQEVKNNLEAYKKEGGVYYFEGVKGGTKENEENFNKALGINFTPDLYENFSKLYGVDFQDTRMFLGLVNDKDFNVDLNIDQIMELYNSKIESNSGTIKNNAENIPLDANKQIIDTLAQLNSRELKVLVYINQAILNGLIQSDSTQNFLSNNFTNKELFEIILGERNKVLVSEIINSSHDKIYVTYGLLHFKGVLKLLQNQDPKWQIIETKYLYPITTKKD